jgi:hypothetical protein
VRQVADLLEADRPLNHRDAALIGAHCILDLLQFVALTVSSTRLLHR